MEAKEGVQPGAQSVGQNDLPRIDSAETGYGLELSDDTELLENFEDDAINAQADREELKRWAEHDM